MIIQYYLMMNSGRLEMPNNGNGVKLPIYNLLRYEIDDIHSPLSLEEESRLKSIYKKIVLLNMNHMQIIFDWFWELDDIKLAFIGLRKRSSIGITRKYYDIALLENVEDSGYFLIVCKSTTITSNTYGSDLTSAIV